MGDGYDHRSLDELESNPEKPGSRWEISPAMEIEPYNFNIAVLESCERLSQNAYHYHENQEEFYYIIAGRCRVEVEDNSFDMDEDDVLLVERGVNHLLHNPFEKFCKLIAIGAPSAGRYPVHQVQSFEELYAERYEDQ
jgi:mannose-6-phosphate isomerase-like protein (cupin superfamily)